MSRTLTENFQKKYDFRWEILDIIISGKSSIDTQQGFSLQGMEDADRFLRSYGYNLDNPIERAEALGNFHESLNFIRRFFLQPENPDGLRIEVPRKLLEITDIRDLFLMASLCYPGQQQDTQGMLLRNWSCSTLKVMHTIAHMDQDIRTPHFADIQKQIFDRYYKHIQRDHEERLYLGERPDDPSRVNLVAFETKPKKARDSTLLKLLHKPENVAEEVFDRVGLRFVTPTRLEALQVVKYLKDKMIVIPPNIKPSRSRNTLVELEPFRESLTAALEGLERGDFPEDQLFARLEEAAHAEPTGSNPHSSRHYRAIQFTCRQLIKLTNPLYDDLKELKAVSRHVSLPEDVARLVSRVDLKHLQKEVRFFYPYEVQVVDEASFEENERGRSAHSDYKKSQLMTALRRVMGTLAG